MTEEKWDKIQIYDMDYKGGYNYKFITAFKSCKYAINNVYIYKT